MLEAVMPEAVLRRFGTFDAYSKECASLSE